MMVLCSSTFLTSCEKDDFNEGIEMRMRNYDNGNDQIYLLSVPESYYVTVNSSGHQVDGYWESSKVKLGISSINNFYVSYGYYDAWYEFCDYDIVCVGSVSGLGRIKKIPTSGWTKEVAVKPGYGYIIRSKSPSKSKNYYNQFCKYARVYVVDWIEGVSGGILGAIIRYQDDWQ